MPNLTIKNIPTPLLERLRETAERNRRSINSEVIRLLERSLAPVAMDPDRLLARARAVRERGRLPYLTDDALRAARDEGRS
jgi:antitoxin FitA